MPGNKIRIICEHEPTLSVERTLSPDGDVVLPLLGRVTLAGKFIAEAEAELQAMAAKKLGDDTVIIAITLVSDGRGAIEFTGSIAKSGSAPYYDGITLDDVVKIAQPNGSAATEAVRITSSDGRTVVVDLNTNGGSTRLKPGDKVFFPRAEASNEVLILGGVEKPGSKPFKPGMTVRALLELAGGITGHGLSESIKLDRQGGATRTFSFDSPDLDQELQRGDVVTVPIVEKGRFVTVNGPFKRPGMVEYRPGLTLSQAIKAAGELLPATLIETIKVKRLGEWTRTFNYPKIMAKEEPDLELKPADIIDVLKSKGPKIVEPKPKPKPRTGPVVPPR